ncbi:MAG: acetyl-CoA carboxylase biotin carboxyl carrier protein [Rhodospirillaceae bacterium]|jgi:acetyl-CoA carboxylase biotin carboxyl carrier protein|nr:acetyl-CoA carboxylase biotin carboxyl carrier protein [Rhodospirillaceae bacterium]MBT5811550.1 acetyl-CoA carboxylase biotin carboxyl carrier protein [Rhodospirillaceae bacterium]
MADIDSDAIRELAKLLDETGLTEIEINEDGRAIRVSRAAAAAVPYAAPPVAPAPQLAPTDTHPAEEPGTVPSPMVGTAYLASGPGEAPFVKTGDEVSEGQTLMIIEAMKVMNPILAPRGGVVRQIFVEDGQPVEFGEALMALT